MSFFKFPMLCLLLALGYQRLYGEPTVFERSALQVTDSCHTWWFTIHPG